MRAIAAVAAAVAFLCLLLLSSDGVLPALTLRALSQRSNASTALLAALNASRAEVAQLRAALAERDAQLQDSYREEDALTSDVEALEAALARLGAAAGAPSGALAAPQRVLACITVGYSMPEYATEARYAMLRRQLHSYREACEAGFDVDVVLVAYEGWDAAAAPLDLAAFVCRRTGASVPVSVEAFALEPLPPGTHGTAGTLAFQHRKIFAREAARYDLFVCQEDDVAIDAGHLAYFAAWSARFAGSDFYPGFVSYEIAPWAEEEGEGEGGAAAAAAAAPPAPSASQQRPWPAASPASVILDWRLSDVCVINAAAAQLAAPWSSSCCMYMLTAAQLARAMAAPTPWLGALEHASTRGEFNPRFGSPRWLHELFAVVVPLRDLARALFWHSTNRYVAELRARMAGGADVPPQSFGVGLNGLSLAELVAVLGACPGSALAGAGGAAGAAGARARTRVEGRCEEACAVATHVRVEKARLFGRTPLRAEYTCLSAAEVHYPFVERR